MLLQAKNFFILCLLRLAQGSADAANCVPDHISLHTAGTQAPAKGEYVARSFAPSLQGLGLSVCLFGLVGLCGISSVFK